MSSTATHFSKGLLDFGVEPFEVEPFQERLEAGMVKHCRVTEEGLLEDNALPLLEPLGCCPVCAGTL